MLRIIAVDITKGRRIVLLNNLRNVTEAGLQTENTDVLSLILDLRYEGLVVYLQTRHVSQRCPSDIPECEDFKICICKKMFQN